MTGAFVDWAIRRGRVIWTVVLLLAIPATWRTAQLYLHLRSDLEELLPREAPSVTALDELRGRMPGLQHLGVLVDVGDASRVPEGERLLDDLAARIRAYPPGLARSVRVGTAEERAFLEAHSALYVDVEDLRTIRERVEARRDHEVARETGSALDDGPAPPLDFADIEKKYETVLSKLGRRGAGGKGARARAGDRFSSAEQHVTMLLVEVDGFDSGATRPKELLSRVKSDVDALVATGAYGRGMRVGYAGDVAISVEELDALVADLSLSSVLVVVAVVAVIALYFRWLRSVAILLPPLLIAAVFAFAIASLPPFGITELNSNTAFLGSIIVGNGINFGIMLLARHVEARRDGLSVREAVVTAVGSARAGTLSAALAAGVAYVSLVATQFRGFRQFGVIGGIGMVASWVLAFVCMPSLVAWLDRGRATAAAAPRHDIHVLGGVARAVRRAPLLVVAVGAILLGASIPRVASFGVDQIESDFSRLRRRDTWSTGEGYWGARMDAVLGEYLTPTVLLADSREQAQAIAAHLRDASTQPGLANMVASVRTWDDVLPTRQDEKLEEAARIREMMTPKMRSLVAVDTREDLDRLLGAADLRRVDARDLPRAFTFGLVERDGTTGRAVLVFPHTSSAFWEGPPLVAYVRALREAGAIGGPRPARVAGALPLSADILASIRRDGPIACAVALVGVVAVVALTFRRRGAALYVVASLLVGATWLAAGALALGVKINFANFIAFPITFGIGVDYAVNVMSRYTGDARRDVVTTIRSTGSAVALCSLTTIIGYASLLVAENRALFYFGVLAVLGEVACLTAAVTLLPAVLVLVERRHPTRRSAEAE